MAIKSYVKIKPIADKDGPFAGSFDEIRKGINRTGATVESIAKNNVETHKLIQFDKEWLQTTTQKEIATDQKEEKEDKKGFGKWFKGFKNMFRLKKREEKEKKDEAVTPEEEEEKTVKKEVKSKASNFLGMLGNFLTPIFEFVVTMGVLKWLSDPEKAKRAGKVFNLIFAIGKFAFKIAEFGVGALASGLINVFGAFKEGPIKGTFKLFLGALQLFAGFKTLQYLLNPLKLFTDGKKLTNLFMGVNEKEVEFKKQEQWRKFGYKDRETGKIYTEQEYKAQKKSVERQQKKLRAQGKNDQAKRVGAKFNSRVKNPTRLQSGKNFGKKMMKPGAQKGLAVVGGISRIASGIAMGEDKTQAVGAGIGQAAGGMLGAAAGTALLGPFLGPFAPIVGNAIGSFLGEWVGKTFLPMIKPLFEPIKKMFSMLWTVVKGVADETGITEFFGTFFQFIGELGKVMMNVMGWLMKPITWLLSGVIKTLGSIIGFIINVAKKIWAVITTPGKVIRMIGMGRWDRVGNDVKLEEVGAAAGGKVTVVHKSKGGIVPFNEPNVVQKMYGGAVHNHTTNLTNIEFSKGGKVAYSYSPIQQFASGGEALLITDKGETEKITGEDLQPASSPVADAASIKADVTKRDEMHKQFQYKNQRDSDVEDIVLPPRTIVMKSTVPVLNTIAAGTRAQPVYQTPSPLFTC